MPGVTSMLKSALHSQPRPTVRPTPNFGEITSVGQIRLLVHHVLLSFDFRRRPAIFPRRLYLISRAPVPAVPSGMGHNVRRALGFLLVGTGPTAIPRSMSVHACRLTFHSFTSIGRRPHTAEKSPRYGTVAPRLARDSAAHHLERTVSRRR